MYHPFPDSNAVWREENYCWYNPNPLLGEYHSYVDSLGGDTLIGAIVYKKILQSGEQRYNSSAMQYYSNVYIGGIRQDTAQRKVFFIEPGKPDTLLYDFSLAVGDTIRSYIDYFNPYIVSSIDSILIAGTFRKRFFISNRVIIEGIGDTWGLLYRYTVGSCIQHGAQLACFTQNGQTIYHPNASFNCSTPVVGINGTQQKFAFEIFPNPSLGSFTLSTSGVISSIEILDVMGKSVLKQGINPPDIGLNLSAHPKGIYFLKAIDERGNFGVKKILLQ